jgi:hypothetical protein
MTLFVKTNSMGSDGGKPKNYNSIESLVVPSAEVDTNMQQPKRTRRSYVLLTLIGFVFVAFLSLNFQRSSSSTMVELLKTSNRSYQPSENCSPRSLGPQKRGGTGKSVIPNDVGAGSFSPFTVNDLFKGYKVTTDEPLMPRLYRSGPEYLLLEGVKSGYTKSQVVETVEQLNQLLNIDGELTVSYGAVSGSGSGSYLGKSVSSSKKKVITYVDRQIIYQIKTKDVGLVPTEDLQTLIYDDNLLKIYEKYGTKMVSAIQYGCSLYARFEISSSNDQDLEDITARVQGEVGFGKMSGEVKAMFEKTDESTESNLRIDVFVTSLGVTLDSVSGTGPKVFDEAYNLIRQYNISKQELLEAHEDITGTSDLDDIDLLDRFVPVAAEIDKLSNYLKQVSVDDNIATFIGKQAKNTGYVLQASYLDYDRLQKAKVDMELKTNKKVYERNNYYRPFYIAVGKMQTELNNKLRECSTYLAKKAGEVYCKGIEAPPPLDYDLTFTIDDLLGNGQILNPWGINEDMFFGGIVAEVNGVRKPIYKGRLMCSNSYDPFGRQDIRTLKRMLENNPDLKCGISESPSEQPTNEPTTHPTSEPTRHPTPEPTLRPVLLPTQLPEYNRPPTRGKWCLSTCPDLYVGDIRYYACVKDCNEKYPSLPDSIYSD